MNYKQAIRLARRAVQHGVDDYLAIDLAWHAMSYATFCLLADITGNEPDRIDAVIWQAIQTDMTGGHDHPRHAII